VKQGRFASVVALAAIGATSRCDTAVRLGNMGPTQTAASAGSSDPSRACEYTVREFAGENQRLSSIDADRVRRWLTDSSSDTSAPCATQLARIAPEFSEGEVIPSEDDVRAMIRTLVRATGSDALTWDVQHDGHQIRAHIIAADLARRGWNAHKLFALGNLAPRDADQRFLRRGGMLSDGSGTSGTSDPREARRWLYHPAAVVLTRVDGRESASFACPDDREQRCSFRVIDPSLRASRATATTDDAIGLFSLRDWLRALRPIESDATRGVSLEFARRAQFLPRVTVATSPSVELVVTEAEQCPVGADALASRRATLRASRHGDPTAGYRTVFAVRSSVGENPGQVEIEGIDEPLFVRDAAMARELEGARSRGALVSVTYADADGVVRGVRVEEGTAPSVCLRAAVTMGD
jgi:hypothetical protein